MKSQDIDKNPICDECKLPVEICNICVFASMSSHFETEKERACLADEYRNMILSLKKRWQDEARVDELEAICTRKDIKSALSGEVGKWITIDERIEQLGGYDI